jgi:hypothetical protein
MTDTLMPPPTRCVLRGDQVSETWCGRAIQENILEFEAFDRRGIRESGTGFLPCGKCLDAMEREIARIPDDP